ncbi:GatB/YqeY domain-containing protein [Neomoorella thermoacetica]|uniref:GatB/YqeY domain-containing protein n=1 Tax=Neomoorella thermoacetica TaxID=1525 RepID=UPI0030CD9D2F
MAENMKEKLTRDMKEALKAHDKIRLQTIRMVLASIKNVEIDKQHPLNDEEIAGVIQKEIKMRQDSLEQFSRGGREDLVEQTRTELKVLEDYLPRQLTEAELKEIIQQTIQETGATSKREMGKVMAALMPKIRGRADGRKANELVKEILAS